MEDSVPESAGLSSYNLLEEKKFFAALALRPGMRVLDIGCGVGNYALAVLEHLGGEGLILAADLWGEGVATLRFRADMRDADNIAAVIADAAGGLPVRKQSVDCCLMATVAHILARKNILGRVLAEIREIVRADGTVAVVEFHRIEGPPGPPLSWRLAPDKLVNIFAACGFQPLKYSDVGPFNYLSVFKKS